MAEKECHANPELLNFGQDPTPRRELRSDYLAVRSFTSEKNDDLVSPDSKKFDVIIDYIDKLHEQARKAAVRRTKPTTAHLPKEINNEGGERTDTDLNMTTMFEILKNKKKVDLNCLILNRRSFAQKVENLFALSFLAKDGRVRIAVEANGSHIVSPTNGPVANEIMMEMVAVGEELMPHRNHTKCTPASGDKPAAFNSQTDTPHTIQTRKHTRNDGLVVQDKYTTEEFLENDDAAGATALRRCKRKLSFNACVCGSLS
ncbi:hypothetical protein ACLB2K_030494 [Fragaria x ananassa]